MIYVTAGDFNEELSRLNDFLSISAITIKNDIQKCTNNQTFSKSVI